MPSKDRNLVISTGSDSELLWLRNAVLRSAGFTVFTTESEKQALEIIGEGKCGVLLLCFSLSEAAKKRLSNAFRKRCPLGRVVLVGNKATDERADFADAIVYAIDGPEALIAAVRNSPDAGSDALSSPPDAVDL
jgi:DNA-binding NtrC family response regulator